MSAGLVSIIVNNCNYEQFLAAALDSALGQRDADVEVIAVDDGSTDGSREIIAQRGSRVRALLQEALGTFENLPVAYAATSTHENGNATGGLHDLVIE